MKICPNCQQGNRIWANFCGQCGLPLDESPHTGRFIQLQPGKLIDERYLVLEQIGEGGLGRVFLATDRAGRRFALKQIREKQSEFDRETYELYIRSFQREANILSSLPHPYLPIARDYIVSSESLVIVMDYIEGRTLADVQDNSPEPLPGSRVIPWAIQICEALDYLHSKTPAIIHRNIKPKNIILEDNLGESEHVRLIGFGLARHYVEGLEKDEDNLGTAGYSPPEQYGLAQTDARSDIFGLGATLYALLSKTDLVKFSDRLDPETLAIDYPDLRSLNPLVSDDLCALVDKAMQPNPAERFQSALEMKAALGSLLVKTPSAGSELVFTLDRPVPLEETRHVEFKEIRSDNPSGAIQRNIEIYAVAFLNSEGGRIFWGIRDDDRVVTGVPLTYTQRDIIRRVVTNSIAQIQPPVSLNAYSIEFHPVQSEVGALEDVYIVEVKIQAPSAKLLYFTSAGESYIKTEAGKKKLSGAEINNEIVRRLQKGSIRLSTPPDLTEKRP